MLQLILRQWKAATEYESRPFSANPHQIPQPEFAAKAQPYPVQKFPAIEAIPEERLDLRPQLTTRAIKRQIQKFPKTELNADKHLQSVLADILRHVADGAKWLQVR
ncbi:hypothetical protein SDC9_189186 [bioreactor metagenome]|uniref:Uncharacterized protein n=1 Tax=bioreactor metagenome TaxID=1076179 RepID=A0A645HT38_9ZZZZ